MMESARERGEIAIDGETIQHCSVEAYEMSVQEFSHQLHKE